MKNLLCAMLCLGLTFPSGVWAAGDFIVPPPDPPEEKGWTTTDTLILSGAILGSAIIVGIVIWAVSGNTQPDASKEPRRPSEDTFPNQGTGRGELEEPVLCRQIEDLCTMPCRRTEGADSKEPSQSSCRIISGACWEVLDGGELGFRLTVGLLDKPFGIGYR